MRRAAAKRAAPAAGPTKAAGTALTFVLDHAVGELLRDTAARAGLSQAGVIELALRWLAHQEFGRPPRRPADSPSTRVATDGGTRLGVRLSAHARQLLNELAERRGYHGARVAVLELALRGFAPAAERAGLLAPG